MEKTYQPNQIEAHWFHFWNENHLFDANDGAPNYCIVLPPPNVTGTLHMGHGFQITLMDALIRYKKMKGENAHWQGGTDHAGIATQMVVERQLAKQHLSRQQLGRELFLEKVKEWAQQSGNIITTQIQRLGASINWEKAHFSLDPSIVRATDAAFIHLYQDGLIYRGKRLVHWDPQLNTALSDLEVVNSTETGSLWYIRYPLKENSHRYLTVATTRPETLFGDVAIAVHPADERYQQYIGKMVKIPIVNREIPIITDEMVDPNFGTGCVKITPGHDFNDYQTGFRHHLPIINIFTPQSKLNDQVPPEYQGLDRFIAREKLIDEIKTLNLLEKVEPHSLTVPRGDRSGAILEPLLTDQWYMKMKPLAARAIEVAKEGKIKFVPENWTKTYLQWLENIEDWCISRQLWWGHRIPVWYDDNNNIYIGKNEIEVRKRYDIDNGIALYQDEDVLDTWFTAALYPFSSFGWPEQTQELAQFYPTDVLVTGFDIIFFWVARMIMLGLYLTKKIPFHEVYVTGLIRDKHGQKMSKTKGNILDPLDLIDGITLEELIKKRCFGLMQPQMAKQIEKETQQEFPEGIAPHGVDALRFTFCALATTGRDIHFDMMRLAANRNFCNKIWNAARFVLMQTETETTLLKQADYNDFDQWIILRLAKTAQTMENHFNQYRFDLIAQTLYDFIWNDFCDWYLEFAKIVLYDTQSLLSQKITTRYVLIELLENILRLLHPVMPFISEEIWQKIKSLLQYSEISILKRPFPQIDQILEKHNLKFSSREKVLSVDMLKTIINDIRNIRGEINIGPSRKISVIFRINSANETEQIKVSLEKYRNYLLQLAGLNDFSFASLNQELPISATKMIDGLEIHVPLAEAIENPADETKRLEKEIAKHQKDRERYENKLNNPDYLTKAPIEVVEKERQKLEVVNKKLTLLNNQLKNIARLAKQHIRD